MKWFRRDKAARQLRLRARPGVEEEQYVQIALEQHFDYLDVLSLRISEQDAFQLQQSDYGVIAGRVLANEGVGVPNCRVSVFLAAPAEDEDLTPADRQLRQRYGWSDVTEQDSSGRRYNLLPAQARVRGFNGFPDNELGIGATPATPVGSFPERETVLADATTRTVYERYYRYTTVTNEAGDFLLLGVPTGTYTLHLDADLTDIGAWSYSPAMLQKVLGYPEGGFEADGARVRSSTDLDSLGHLVSQNVSVTVRPLWTQHEQTDYVGITRQDFKLGVPLRPHFTVAGSLMTMARNRWWGDNLIFRVHFGWRNLYVNVGNVSCDTTPSCEWEANFCAGLNTKLLDFTAGNCPSRPKGFFFCLSFEIPNIIPFLRFEVRDDYCRLDGGKYDASPFDFINHGATCEREVSAALSEVPDSGLTDALHLSSQRPDEADITLFNLTPEVSDEQASRWLLELQAGGKVAASDFSEFDPFTGVAVMAETSYLKLVEPGQFALQVFCNRRPMVTSEDGHLVESLDPKRGVMTEFRGSLLVRGKGELDNPPTKDRVGRLTVKIPQSFDYNQQLNARGEYEYVARENEWIFNHALFSAGKLYSVAQFIPTRKADMSASDEEGNDFFSDRKGWENQTGLLLYTKTDGRDALVPNHETRLGDEMDYVLPGGEVPASNTVPPPPITSTGANTPSYEYTTSYAAGAVTNGITVASPTGGTTWDLYEWFVLQWSYAGGAPARVSVEVVLPDLHVAYLVGSTAGTSTTMNWEAYLKPEHRAALNDTVNARLVVSDENNPAVYGVSAVFQLLTPEEETGRPDVFIPVS